MTKKKVLTIKEAAQLIDGINEYRIRQMCKTGQLRAFKAGRKFLIAETDLYEAVFGTDFNEPRPCGSSVGSSMLPASGKSFADENGGAA